MVILTFIFAVLLLFGLFFLFRFAGRMGWRPSPNERMHHNANDGHSRGPRATGMN